MGPPWIDDLDFTQLALNLAAVETAVIENALSSKLPGKNTAREWHRQMYKDIAVPSPAYPGGYRGDSHAHLVDTRVEVGGVRAVRPDRVASNLNKFFTEFRQ